VANELLVRGRGGKIDKGSAGTSQVPRCSVEDGIFLGELRRPARRLSKRPSIGSWCLEDGTREGQARRCLFWCGLLLLLLLWWWWLLLSVWIPKAVSPAEISTGETDGYEGRIFLAWMLVVLHS
jgi:hypothetical protein